jgi:hypothetical protein
MTTMTKQRTITRVPARREEPDRRAHAPAARRFQLDTSIRRLTPAERAEKGRDLRAAVPRSSHAEFQPAADRPDPVDMLVEQSRIALMFGRDDSDPLFLQMKEAEESVLSRFVGVSKYTNQGQRVVEGQRLMQASSDIFLGWQRLSPAPDGVTRDFYVRQRGDWKFSIDAQTLVPKGLSDYGEVCGWTLARAHARSGDRIAIAAHLGSSDAFDKAIADFSASYADQNEHDYAALDDAAKSGRILAERGV